MQKSRLKIVKKSKQVVVSGMISYEITDRDVKIVYLI
jgi:hypothetical protein